MLSNLTGWHALLIFAIVLLVFGSTKLPSLARSVGQSVRILKDEVHEGATASPASSTTTSAPQAVPHVTTAPAAAPMAAPAPSTWSDQGSRSAS